MEEPPHFKSVVSPTLGKMFHRLCSGKKISGPRSCHWLMPVHLPPAPTPAAFGFMIPVFPSWRVWKLHEYYDTVCTYCLAFPGVPISRTNKLTKLERRTCPQRSLILTRFRLRPVIEDLLQDLHYTMESADPIHGFLPGPSSLQFWRHFSVTKQP